MRSALQQCSPHIHPYRWLIINTACIIWSALLLIFIFINNDDENSDKTIRIEFHYLVYDFITCIIWVIEVLMNVLDYRGCFVYGRGGEGNESLLSIREAEGSENSKVEEIALFVEVILATYFFMDSTDVFSLSKEEINGQSKYMSFDIFINLLAYAFMAYRQLVTWQSSDNHDIDEGTISLHK